MAEINKASLEKLRKTRVSKAAKKPSSKKSNKGPGFQVGRGGAKRARNLVFDSFTDEALDDLCYLLKKKLGRRVSGSEVIRAAFRVFHELPESEQIDRLVDG
jgi:hypothetical protein